MIMGAYHYVLVLFHEPNVFYLIFPVTSKEVAKIGLGRAVFVEEC